MSKHIIISKGTLDLSRDRLKRRLEASLDNHNQDTGFEVPFNSRLDTGEESNFSEADFTSFQTSPVQSQIDKFYLRYGINWREMYIGSKL